MKEICVNLLKHINNSNALLIDDLVAYIISNNINDINDLKDEDNDINKKDKIRKSKKLIYIRTTFDMIMNDEL